MVVIVIITDVIFFATVFLEFEDTTQKNKENDLKALAWLLCILNNKGDKTKCLGYAAKMVVPEKTAIAVIYLLSCNGIWAALLIGRFSMLIGWWHLIRDLVWKKPVSDEFVSYHARRLSEADPCYEMLGSHKAELDVTCGTPTSLSPGPLMMSPTTNPPSLPQIYQFSRSSKLSSTLDSSDIDVSSPNGRSSMRHSSLTYKGEVMSEGEEEFHHGLTPKPPSSSHHRR